ncbi:hypothetical protein GCM10023353_39520 [Tomitella cavernea]|uniref:Uncharacterized protein n=1 Tax=Tomitella cavernea TaxID=1387982 RepID=A0ABP9D644_9ACTN
MHRTSEMSDYERSVWQRLVAETTEDHDTPPGYYVVDWCGREWRPPHR